MRFAGDPRPAQLLRAMASTGLAPGVQRGPLCQGGAGGGGLCQGRPGPQEAGQGGQRAGAVFFRAYFSASGWEFFIVVIFFIFLLLFFNCFYHYYFFIIIIIFFMIQFKFH